MAEFVYLFRGAGPNHTPEQLQQEMQRWGVWMKNLESKGFIKEQAGRPLERTGQQVRGKQRTITDGPYAEKDLIIGGYLLVEAKDLAQATELTAGCPVLEHIGGLVEVRPVMKMTR